MTHSPPDRPLRVVQWGTGNTGQPALRALITRPEFELVGVHAHSPDKIGRDAAQLCGLDEPTGVVATDDVDALLAAGADCVSYMVQGETRISRTLDELGRVLAAGVNVVNTALVFLINPAFMDARLRGRLDAACAAGDSTLFTSGIDPGWSGDVLPLVLAQMCETVESVRVSELMDYRDYPDPGFTGAFFGYGRPLDYPAPLCAPGAMTATWGGMLQLVADALGWTIDEIVEEHERVAAPDTFETAMGTIEKGMCAGIRFTVTGMVGGRPAVVAAHVNRLRDDLGPDWPVLSNGRSGYRIEVTGRPSYRCEIEPSIAGGDHTEAGVVGTALRMVNAIPAVCAAAPGLVTPLDLPFFTSRGAAF